MTVMKTDRNMFMLVSVTAFLILIFGLLGFTSVALGAPPANPDLQSLTLSSGILNPVFDSATFNYTAAVANNITSITVTPTAVDSRVPITANEIPVTSGQASAPISLNVGYNTITVVLTAKSIVRTYTVTVYREPSNNADLSSLALSTGFLSPAFVSGVTSYTASVTNSVSSITVTPTAADTAAVIKVNGVTVTSGQASAPISLNEGDTVITVTVTAQDGVTTANYMVTVNRAAAANVNLASITTSTGILMPTFTPNNTAYSMDVPYEVSSIEITAAPEESSCSICKRPAGCRK